MIDMREITPGCVLDEFHFSMWVGFIEFALKSDEMRAEFERETGAFFPRLPSNGLEIAIDKACGFDREADQMRYVADFARWVTPLYFGGPEDICPAIAAKLAASGIETEGHDRADGHGAKHESPTAEGGDAQ